MKSWVMMFVNPLRQQEHRVSALLLQESDTMWSIIYTAAIKIRNLQCVRKDESSSHHIKYWHFGIMEQVGSHLNRQCLMSIIDFSYEQEL